MAVTLRRGLVHGRVGASDPLLNRGLGGPVQAHIINSVLGESERTGATILAEGIERVEHAEVARTMGAGLGLGWRPVGASADAGTAARVHRPSPTRQPCRLAFTVG